MVCCSIVWRSKPLSGTPSGEREPCWQKQCWQIYAHGLHGYVGASEWVAPLGNYSYFLSVTFLVLRACTRTPRGWAKG